MCSRLNRTCTKSASRGGAFLRRRLRCAAAAAAAAAAVSSHAAASIIPSYVDIDAQEVAREILREVPSKKDAPPVVVVLVR